MAATIARNLPLEANYRNDLTASELADLETWWRAYLLAHGFTVAGVRPDRNGLWIPLGPGGSVQIQPNVVKFHGSAQHDPRAINAFLDHVEQHWDGRCQVFGDDAFKQRVWAVARSRGVDVYNIRPAAGATHSRSASPGP
jgi:hypothetical protein